MALATGSTVGRIRALLTPSERRRAVVLLALMVVAALLETASIGLVIPAITVLTDRELAVDYPAVGRVVAQFGDADPDRIVTVGLLALVGVFLLKTAFCTFVVFRQTTLTFDIQARLSEQLFTSYLRQPYTFHLQRNSAQLLRNAITDVKEFTMGVVLPSMLLVTEGMVLLGVAVLLVVVQPLGAAAVIAIMSAAVFVFYRVTRQRVLRWGEARHYHDGMRIQHVQQGLGAAKDVKLLGREEEFFAQYRTHNRATARAAHHHVTLLELPRLGLEFLGVVALTILVFVMVAQGRDVAATIPTLGVFAAAAFRLMPSVNRMVSSIQYLRYGLPVVAGLYEEVRIAPPAPAVRARVATAGMPQRIALHAVSFTYPDAATPALRDVTLAIRGGESVGVIGASGSGKSTLVDVILGLLTPQAGQILVDGQDIQTDLRSWQDRIGYVPQSIYLTDDTVRRNVAFGVPDGEIDDDAVWRAIRAAQLEEFVAGRPEGVQALLGERGVRLSGGQRQRLGIARALYHDPSVLVLDEATSALDGVTEDGVMQAVMALHGEKTILVVAHRLSTVERCDRLYRLEQGSLVQEGSYAELVVAGRGRGPDGPAVNS